MVHKLLHQAGAHTGKREKVQIHKTECERSVKKQQQQWGSREVEGQLGDGWMQYMIGRGSSRTGCQVVVTKSKLFGGG